MYKKFFFKDILNIFQIVLKLSLCVVDKLICNFVYGFKKIILMVLFNFIIMLFKFFYYRNVKYRIKWYIVGEFNVIYYLEVDN